MAANILSDLLFLAITILFLIIATDFLEARTTSNLIWMGLIAAISPFQRYAGLTLILTGVLLVLFSFRRYPGRAVLRSGLFGILTSLPILIWVFFHNYLPTGILFGDRMPPVFLGNLQVTIEKAEHWFVPATLTNIIPFWVIASIILLILITGNRPLDWKRWMNSLVEARFLPSLIFLVLYLGVLIFNVSYYEVRFPYMDRIHIIMLPALLALIFLAFHELTPNYLRTLEPKRFRIITIFVFLLWLSFPIYNIQKYMKRAYYQGDVSEFNMFNISALRDSGIQQYLAAQPAVPDQKVYSNYEAAAWFLTRYPITKMPFGDVKDKRVDAAEVLQKFPGWPGRDGDGYVIWIKALSYKPYVLNPEQLAERADFELLYTSEGGDIYRLTPK
jgi:hypothetical protein